MHIAVLSGGTDGEREVSLKSGTFVAETLEKMSEHTYDTYILPDQLDAFLESYTKYDLVFPMFHGAYGEDGKIFGLLEALEVPHTHSTTSVHSLCFNKSFTNRLAANIGIICAQSWLIQEGETIAPTVIQKDFLNKKFFVKPNTGGSSIGAFKVSDGSQINDYIQKSQSIAPGDTIVEEYIEWIEYSVGIIGDAKKQEILPIMQVQLDQWEFFDFDVKYNGIGGSEIFPKDIDEKLKNELENLASRLYTYFNCTVLARFDFIVRDGVPHLLEINTVPGFSAVSIIPRAWRELGKTNQELIQKVIDVSIEKWS